jgi:glycopeptide antibiotics resistance protein
MEYTISKTKRNGIILSSTFLILYVFISGLLFIINKPTKIEIAERLIRNAIYLIPFGYLMLAMFKYFKHYKLKILLNSILIIFIMELIFKSTLFPNIVEFAWQKVVLLSTSTIWIIATIALIVGTFKNKAKAYPGMLSIRNYAISSLFIYVFATTYTFYLRPTNPLDTRQLIELTSAIPYIFTIAFAMKLKLKE